MGTRKKTRYTEVESTSGDGSYTVTWTEEVDFRCQCKSFVFRGTCKHIRQVQKQVDKCLDWNK